MGPDEKESYVEEAPSGRIRPSPRRKKGESESSPSSNFSAPPVVESSKPAPAPPAPPAAQAQSTATATGGSSTEAARLFAQEPTRSETIATVDALDRKRLTDSLVRLLQDRTDHKPLSIALFGHWGSGKSSQIAFLRGALDAKRFVCADFNAWQNERVDNIGAALAQTIVESLVRGAGILAQVRLAIRLSVRRKTRLKEAAARDLREVQAAGYAFLSAYGALLLWPVLAGCTLYLLLRNVGADAVVNYAASAGVAGWALVAGANRLVTKDLVDWFKRIATPAGGLLVLPDYSDKLGSFHEINRTLDDLCALTLDAPDGVGVDRYLLVIVDDLDRCGPATVKQVFDAVRLVASIPRVVVLVALDERIAFSAVEKHYAEYGYTGREPAQVARDYLAKVFQVSVTLPPIDAASAANFIRTKLFDEKPPAPATTPVGAPPVVQQSIAPEPAPTKEEVDTFIAMAKEFGLTNPRELWRMRQSWSLLKGVGLANAMGDAELKAWLRHLFEREKSLQGDAQERRRAQQQPAPPGDPGFGARERFIKMVLLPSGDLAREAPAPKPPA